MTIGKSAYWGIGILGMALAMTHCRQEPEVVDFNAQIRPVLNANCLRCHGGVRQLGEFSLLFRDDALKKAKSGKFAIVPGHPEQSELIARLRHHDPDERMPLKSPAISNAEISLLETWIRQGAAWEDHWAYVPPKRRAIPDAGGQWAISPIDHFIAQRAETEGLTPAPEANGATLLRRVTLDLIGLAPTAAEYKAFAQDTSPNGYAKVVDRLLRSPHYGERWAAMWLDLARYGDSQGYQKDRARPVWQYRDWVIDAFNHDMPFDRFTTEQLAGDLLANPTTDQLIATAFNRNTNTNDEGGTDDEEFRTVAVLDRVNTTFEVWQGTTISCVQCHSHPYDPFRHKEYYQLVAYFNNTADADRTNDTPTLNALTSVQLRQLQALHQHPDSLPPALRPANTPIMHELPADSSRKTYQFVRGNWLVHGDEVRPTLPNSLVRFAKTPLARQQHDRLTLARWLVSRDNPLTARVMVNRLWEQLFGAGLVGTLSDFGTQGDRPTHPELLDYLALRFRDEYRWSMKKLLRELVLSATYRQSSNVTPEGMAKDPQNRLLARGPRVRLTAEQVRDQALTVSGLLCHEQFGPPVMPPQPDGVWQTIRNVMKWKEAAGEDRYRRGIYTFWRKSSPYPSFVTFDAPSREFCVSKRVRTNTPLQALVTLNDPVYWESAQALAGRVSNSANPIDVAYQLLMGHNPQAAQLASLQKYYARSLTYYRVHPADARQVITLKTLKATPEMAALTLTTNVLLNLDEVVTKE